MKILSIYILLLFPYSAFAQIEGFQFPEVIQSAENVYSFIPHGWGIRDTSQDIAYGQWEGSDTSFSAMVLQDSKKLNVATNDPESGFTPKMLIVLLKQPDNSWKLSTVAIKIFDTSGDDMFSSNAYQNIKAQHDTLALTFGTGGTVEDYSTYYFRFQDNDWYLIGQYDEETDLQKSLGVFLVIYKNINYITGEEDSYEYSSKSKKYNHLRKFLSIKPLIKLSLLNNN